MDDDGDAEGWQRKLEFMLGTATGVLSDWKSLEDVGTLSMIRILRAFIQASKIWR